MVRTSRYFSCVKLNTLPESICVQTFVDGRLSVRCRHFGERGCQRSPYSETNLETDLGDAKIARSQQPFCALNSLLNQVCMWCFVKISPEQSQEMIGREKSFLGDSVLTLGVACAKVEIALGTEIQELGQSCWDSA